jgi:hypothetical protein
MGGAMSMATANRNDPSPAADLPQDLIRSLIAALPGSFKNRKDVENAVHHRVEGIKYYQKLQGMAVGDDFLLTEDGGIVTDLIWITGWRRGTDTLIIEFTGTGEFASYCWAPISSALEATVMVKGVLPDLDVDCNSGHLAARRFRGNHRARSNLEPANVTGAVRAAVLSNQEVVRTIYRGEVSWAVPVPLYRVYAMVSVNKANLALSIGTVISPWQYQRHINSACCARSETNGEAY